MYLEHLHVQNYRCYEEASIDFEESGLVLITGRNNVGKSALLKAIDELFHDRPQPSNARDPGLRTHIEGVFRLSESDKKELTLGASNHELDLSYPIRLVRHVDAAAGQELVGKWYVEIASGVRVTPKKLALPNVPDDERDKRVDALAASFSHRFFHFDPVRTGTHDGTTSLQASESLRQDGSNLAAALLYLLSRHHTAFGEIQGLLDRLVPDAGQLTTPTGERKLSIEFKQAGSDRTLPIKKLGTGVEQLVMTAYAGYRHDRGALLLLEEPEAHLHAGAQRQLAEQLNEWAGSHQILAATHSPIFMDACQPDRSQILLVEKTGDKSSVRPADDLVPDVLRELGVRLSDVISANRILVVEGPSDVNVVEAWFGDLFISNNVAVVAAGGGHLANQADTIGGWLEDLGRARRPVLFLRDRDELADQEVEKLERKKGPDAAAQVHVLEVRELENYLCTPAALRAFFELEESDEAIDAELREIADQLAQRVVIKRVMQALRGERWLMHQDGEDLIEANADAQAITSHFEERLRRMDGVVKGLGARVAEIQTALGAEWDQRWRSIAPGEEMLRAYFERRGRKFRKTRDAVVLARAAGAPPALESRLREFVSPR